MSHSADEPSRDDDDEDEPRAGDVWLALIEGKHEDKVRPAVVISVEDDRIEVVYGGGTAHPDAQHLRIAAASSKGGSMGLSKVTYFWHSNVAFVDPDVFEEFIGECPVYVFDKLQEIAFNYHLRQSSSASGEDDPEGTGGRG